MLYLKTSYGDLITLIDTDTGNKVATITVRGLENVQGVDLFNIAIDSDRRYKIVKTMLKDQFSNE